MVNNSSLDTKVIANFMKVKLGLLIPEFVLLFLVFVYVVFFNDGVNYTEVYINCQKDLFYALNHTLSQFPNLQYNLTQLGDVVIFFPLLTIFLIYAPKLWEALLTSAILSLIASAVLKKLFSVPRPAAVFDHDGFTIIGKALTGKTSLPSGHSIATFVVITIVLFAFMPKKNTNKFFWSIFMVLLGLVIAFSRVGVGAHYPLDVIIGSTIGFMVSVIGIKISNKVNWFGWLKNRKYHPIFMAVLTIWGAFIVTKIIDMNLLIFYISVASLVVTLYLMTRSYVKKIN